MGISQICIKFYVALWMILLWSFNMERALRQHIKFMCTWTTLCLKIQNWENQTTKERKCPFFNALILSKRNLQLKTIKLYSARSVESLVHKSRNKYRNKRKLQLALFIWQKSVSFWYAYIENTVHVNTLWSIWTFSLFVLKIGRNRIKR